MGFSAPITRLALAVKMPFPELGWDMKRREFIAFIGAVATASPFAAHAQQRDGMRRLGVLMGNHSNDPMGQALAAALVQGLGALDWHGGDNLRIEWRWAGGDPALFQRYAAELVALSPDAVLAQTSPAVVALRRETNTIPIVFVTVTDPVGRGFVVSLAHPGDNITGFSDFDAPMAGKWLGMLTQILPPVAHVVVLFNPATAPQAGLMLRAIDDTASAFAVAVRPAPVQDDSEIESIMSRLAREDRVGVLVLAEIFTWVHRDAIIAAAARHRLPAIYYDRSFVAAGGLMSYGLDPADQFRRAASYIDRILKGSNPGDLPVQNPVKFELAINLKTAEALGVSVPPALLGSADLVID
jgi:putative ABC transport system substrate-binding protein